MTNLIEDAIEALPPFLSLGNFSPSRRRFNYETFDAEAVRCPEDLPSYLIFGALSREHFEFTSTGWKCRWQSDRDDTFFQWEYDRERRRTVVSDRWHGIDGGLARCPSEMDPRRVIAEVRYGRFPPLWDEAAAKETQERYRIQYIKAEDLLSVAGVPDGPMKILCIPLAIGDLRPFISSFGISRTSKTFTFPFRGYLRRSVGVVNYVSGLNPPWASDPKELMLKTLETSGFVPLAMPTLERGADGSSALTVRRILYLAFITVPFAGLLPMVEWLNHLGWIAARGSGDPAATPRNGIEFESFIGPAILDLETPYVTLWDKAGCRRATWIMPNKEAALNDLLHERNMSIDDALALAKDAERVGIELLTNLGNAP